MQARFKAPLLNPWAFTYLAVGTLLLFTTGAYQHPRAPLALLPLVVMHLTDRVLFFRRIDADEDGVSSRTLFGARSLRWDDVKEVRFKPSTYNKGHTYPAWTRVVGDEESVAWLSKMNGYEELERFAAARLAERGIDYEAVKDAAREKSWYAAPSWEDLPRVLLGLVLVFASIAFLLTLLA